MTDTELLKELIGERGIKRGKIAKTLNLSYFSLQQKISNKVGFKANEIDAFCQLLGISDLELKERIFFKKNVG